MSPVHNCRPRSPIDEADAGAGTAMRPPAPLRMESVELTAVDPGQRLIVQPVFSFRLHADGQGVSMLASDIMTTEVVTATPRMSIQDVAKILSAKGISGVPVVDQDNRVIGMVSEGDLLHRREIGTERRRPWWLDMISSTNQAAGDYIRSHSGSVHDVMTPDILSVVETTPVAEIALLLESRRIKRVPVLRDGKLVGIVSRANLVRALAMTVDAMPNEAEADDRRIARRCWMSSAANDGRRSRRVT
jgi:CBS domain-containing protein